jgi:ATP-dependent DNA ligase
VAAKKDGVRAQYIDKFISRSGKPITGMSHIEKHMAHNLDGELCAPGMGFDDSSGVVRSNSESPEIVFWVFDAPFISDCKFARYRWLYDNVPETDSIKLVEHKLVTDANQLMEFYADQINKGEEGIVIYDPEQGYEDARIWWRLVPIESEDCKVVGVYEGNGKLSGSLGGIIIDYNGKEVKVGTGFAEKILKSQENQLVSDSDKTLLRGNSLNSIGISIGDISPVWLNIRSFIWENKEHFIGKIAKIEYKEKTKAGSMRQPRFKCWRIDKEC